MKTIEQNRWNNDSDPNLYRTNPHLLCRHRGEMDMQRESVIKAVRQVAVEMLSEKKDAYKSAWRTSFEEVIKECDQTLIKPQAPHAAIPISAKVA